MRGLLYVAMALACFAAGWVCGEGLTRAEVLTETRTEVRYDTVRTAYPVVRDSMVTRYVTRTLHVATTDTLHTADTVSVTVPITQRVYFDTAYTAWVSGYEARLDSIEVYRRNVTTVVSMPPKRWGLGVTAGYAATPRGLQPMVGIGITYNLVRF